MSAFQKLIDSVRNNPKDVRFDDACKIAERLGFVHKGKGGGSHRAFSKSGEPTALNFQQHTGGKIKAYHARQLIEMIEKYWDESDE